MCVLEPVYMILFFPLLPIIISLSYIFLFLTFSLLFLSHSPFHFLYHYFNPVRKNIPTLLWRSPLHWYTSTPLQLFLVLPTPTCKYFALSLPTQTFLPVSWLTIVLGVCVTFNTLVSRERPHFFYLVCKLLSHIEWLKIPSSQTDRRKEIQSSFFFFIWFYSKYLPRCR